MSSWVDSRYFTRCVEHDVPRMPTNLQMLYKRLKKLLLSNDVDVVNYRPFEILAARSTDVMLYSWRYASFSFLYLLVYCLACLWTTGIRILLLRKQMLDLCP